MYFKYLKWQPFPYSHCQHLGHRGHRCLFPGPLLTAACWLVFQCSLLSCPSKFQSIFYSRTKISLETQIWLCHLYLLKTKQKTNLQPNGFHCPRTYVSKILFRAPNQTSFDYQLLPEPPFPPLNTLQLTWLLPSSRTSGFSSSGWPSMVCPSNAVCLRLTGWCQWSPLFA